MGVSKQAVSQLLDTLVERGYVERALDPLDRRRTKLKLTRRGVRVASLCRGAVDRVERQLVKKLGAICIENMRATLAALIDLATGLESGTTD
jgi:DNA-binding MarR family transcriptional regulator